jgi:hypothetical protein
MRPWAGTPVRTADGLIRLARCIEEAEESLDVDPTPGGILGGIIRVQIALLA